MVGNIFRLICFCILLAFVNGSNNCNYCIGFALQGGANSEPYLSVEQSLNSEINDELLSSPTLSGLIASAGCPKTTATTKSCMNQCVTIAVNGNVENYAGPMELQTSLQVGDVSVPMTASTVRMLKYGNFAFRGCLEDAVQVLGLFTDKQLPVELASDQFHQAGTCSTIQGAIFSSTIKASLCSCVGTNCNNADVSADAGAAPIHQTVNSSSFAAVCPPQSSSPSDNNDTIPTTCSGNAVCSTTQQLCCPAAGMSTNVCKDPLYTKNVTGAKCSEARFTNNATGQLLSAIMQTSISHMQMLFPPFSSDCNQAQTTSKYLTKCETYSVTASITADFRNYNGPQSMSSMFEMLTNIGFGPQTIADTGKVSLMMRTCAEELFSEAMSDGFPMIGNGVESLSANLLIFNVPITISLQACNTDVTGGCGSSIQPLAAIAQGECLGGYNGSSCGEITVFGMTFSEILDIIKNESMGNNTSTPCPPGMTGPLCDNGMGVCSSNPCANGGTCNDYQSFFMCSCRPGYNGARCNVNTDAPPSNTFAPLPSNNGTMQPGPPPPPPMPPNNNTHNGTMQPGPPPPPPMNPNNGTTNGTMQPGLPPPPPMNPNNGTMLPVPHPPRPGSPPPPPMLHNNGTTNGTNSAPAPMPVGQQKKLGNSISPIIAMVFLCFVFISQ